MPEISRYEFKFDREPSKPKAARLIQKWLLTFNSKALGIQMATDWRKYLITSKPLPQNMVAPRQIIMTQDDEDEPALEAAPSSRRYQVGLMLPPTSFSIQQLLKSLQAPGEGDSRSKPEIITALNIIIGHRAKELSLGTRPSLMSTDANKHFDIDCHPIQTLGGGLVAFRGYQISVRATATRFLLNAQIKHAVAYQQGPLTALARSIGLDDLTKLGRSLRMCKVLLTHLPKKMNSRGHEILRIKSIWGLAKPRSDDKAKCAKFGAGPSKVSFFFDDKRAGDKGWRSVRRHFSLGELQTLICHKHNAKYFRIPTNSQ